MRTTFLTLIGVAGITAMASAQSVRPERPYRGLFGSSPSGETDQVLLVGLSGVAGYDTDVLSRPSEGGVPSPGSGSSPSGGYGQFTGSAQYTLTRKRIGASASASATTRYTPVLGQSLQTAYGLSASAWAQTAQRTRLMFSESSSIQPFLSYSFFPVAVDPEVTDVFVPAFDTAITPERQIRHSLSASVTQNLTSRASVTFDGGYGATRSTNHLYDLVSYSAGGRFAYQLRRGLGVHAGYGYSEGRYADASHGKAPVAHNIDVGVDYNRPLSFSRRTTLTFGTGSSVVDDPAGTQYHVTANARLTYELNRTWSAALAYLRNTGFVQNLRAPVFADSASLSISGLSSRRMQISAGLGAAVGTVGFNTGVTRNRYQSYSAHAGVVIGLARYIGLTADYSFYKYSFDNAAQLPFFTTRDMNRQSVQAGFSLKPSLRRGVRRSDAAR